MLLYLNDSLSYYFKMNIYDFDKTIYDGDSSIDFFKYCIKKKKKCLIIIPKIILSLLLYIFHFKNKEYFKSTFFSFLKYIEEKDKIVNDFWKCHENKIKKFYLNQKKDTDIIISASPEFLLRPIALKLNFKLIATKVDINSGKLLGKNCYGEEKVKRLNNININSCDNFYSDSLSDLPLYKISKKGYLVNKEELTVIDIDKIIKKS